LPLGNPWRSPKVVYNGGAQDDAHSDFRGAR
jgi:hypothetical protein